MRRCLRAHDPPSFKPLLTGSHRSVSFSPPTAFCTLALELISFPFAFELAVAGHLPTTSLACSAEPWMRSLSTMVDSNTLSPLQL
jgi:hypothetical protein